MTTLLPKSPAVPGSATVHWRAAGGAWRRDGGWLGTRPCSLWADLLLTTETRRHGGRDVPFISSAQPRSRMDFSFFMASGTARLLHPMPPAGLRRHLPAR